MIETESTLIVCSNEPGEVIARIAELRSIAEFDLVPQKTQVIEDTYFDREDRALESKKLGLRTREANKQRLITLKGPPRLNEANISQRLEIELRWSNESLQTVVGELINWGIEIEELSKDVDFDQPERVVAKLGLEVIQRRENRRQIRNVVRSGHANDVLAELAIDSLAFNFNGQQVHHKEVEIEAKSDEGVNLIPGLTATLQGLFPSDLVAWDYGKLSTGLVIEHLSDSGELKSLLDENGNLKPEAYPRILALLDTSGPGAPGSGW